MSITAVRKLLGSASKSLSDEQIQAQRDKLYEFAGVAIDTYQGFLERADELDEYTMNLGGDTPFLHLMGWSLEQLEELADDIDRDADQDEEVDSEPQDGEE